MRSGPGGAPGAVGEEELVGRLPSLRHLALGGLDQRGIGLQSARFDTEAPGEAAAHRLLVKRTKAIQRGDQRLRFGQRPECDGELAAVPQHRLGLPAEGTQPQQPADSQPAEGSQASEPQTDAPPPQQSPTQTPETTGNSEQ